MTQSEQCKLAWQGLEIEAYGNFIPLIDDTSYEDVLAQAREYIEEE